MTYLTIKSKYPSAITLDAPTKSTFFNSRLLKSAAFLMTITVFCLACNKHSTPAPEKRVVQGISLSGKWRIDSLVSIFRYSNGDIRGVQLYPQQPGIDFYFIFNDDGTWSETYVFDGTTAGDQSSSNGRYELKSDTTFNLIYPNNQILVCKITKLTTSEFVFHRTYPTIFDGTIPGTIERIFTLKK